MKNFILTNKQLIGFIVACIFIIISCKKEDGKSSIDVAEYHKNILEAEKNILRKQYTKAEDHYNAAWHFIQTPFPEDIYNRMLCNRLIGDKEKLFDLLNELVETTGISMSKLKQRYRFLLRYSDKWATFKELYPSLIKNHNDKRITELTDIALQIQQLDQKYRKTEDRYTTYKQHNITADSINVRRLLELLENHGYPTAEEI